MSANRASFMVTEPFSRRTELIKSKKIAIYKIIILILLCIIGNLHCMANNISALG